MSKGEAKIRIIPEEEARAAAADATTPARAAAPPVSARGRLYHCCHGEEPRSSDCAIVLDQKVYDEVTAHLGSDTAREHGGLLLGHERQVSENEVEVWITHSLQATHTEATSARLTFTEETWAEFDRQTELLCGLGLNLRRVGWYHSHPNHGVFLSSYDLNVCAEFTRPTHVALVVDPVRNEGGFFVRGEDGYRPHKPQGFWESLGDREHSVINWRNVSSAESGEPAATQGAVADVVRAELTNVVNPPAEEQREPPHAEAAQPGRPVDDVPAEPRPEVIRIRASGQAETGGVRPGGGPSKVPRWALLLAAIAAPALLAAPTVRLAGRAVDWIRSTNETTAESGAPAPSPPPPAATEVAQQTDTEATGTGTQAANSLTNTSGSGLVHGPANQGRRRRGNQQRERQRHRINKDENNKNANNRNANNRNANNNNTRTDDTDADGVDADPERETGEGNTGTPANSNARGKPSRRTRQREPQGPAPRPASNERRGRSGVFQFLKRVLRIPDE
jgi:proteasome lid subunit RPN8/RPN11